MVKSSEGTALELGNPDYHSLRLSPDTSARTASLLKDDPYSAGVAGEVNSSNQSELIDHARELVDGEASTSFIYKPQSTDQTSVETAVGEFEALTNQLNQNQS